MPPREQLDALIARAQQGELRAFEALVEGHLAEVRRFARAFAAGEVEADDLAQEALLRVHRGLRTYRYQSSFTTWLFSVVRSAVLDQARGRARREGERPLDEGDAELPSGEPGADERLAGEQERRRVWAAIRQVPEEFRTVLVLFDIEGRPYDEVASIEGVPLGTVKSRLSRGRAHLRRLLDPAPDEAPGTSGGPAASHLSRSGS